MPFALAAALVVGVVACAEQAAAPGGTPSPADGSPPSTAGTAATQAMTATATVSPTVASSACTLDTQTDGPWYDAMVTFEHFDSGRSHNFRCATFGGSMSGRNTVTATPLDGLYPTPYNLVTRADGEFYVYGGGYGDFPGAPGHFVAKIDGANLAELWRTQLFSAADNPAAWDYPGVTGVHENGYIYTVYRTELAKIDSADGTVLATAELPFTGAPDSSQDDTTYNGFNGFSDGRLVAKTVNRQVGCSEQGFSAFLDCPCSSCVPPSLVAVVDPDSMEVLSQVTAPEQIGGRLTTTYYDGKDLLYLPGSSKVYRYVWDGKALALDDTWGPVEYILPGQTTAPAAAVCGDWVVMQTNSVPADTPLSVVTMRQSDAKTVNLQPWAGEGKRNEKSFLPSMITCDPDNSRVYVMDAGYGYVGGFSLDQATGELTQLWRENQRTLNFSTLIGPADARVWMASDIKGNYTDLGTYQEEAVVWRDAATGTELARSEDLPKMTSGALITPGPASGTFYLGLAGTIQHLAVAPTR
jgi:hypothetical protein